VPNPSPNVVTAVQEPAAGGPTSDFHRWRWTGLAGSVLVAVGGLGAGALPKPDPWTDVPVLRVLRHGAGPGVCIGLAAVGMLLLVLAWWRLRPRAGVAPSPGWVTRTALWWGLPLALAPPLFSRDLYIYAGQGLVLARGLDPYQVGPAAITGGPGADWITSLSPTWSHTPAPYGPLFLLVSGRAADAADGRLMVAVGLLRVAAVLGFVTLALLIPRLAAAYGGDPTQAQWLVAANPFLLAHLVGGGHNEALMLPLLVGALLVAAPRRSSSPDVSVAPGSTGPPGAPAGARRPGRVLAVGAAAGALAGLAAAVKISAVVALPFVALLIAADLPAVSGWWPRWLRLGRASAVVLGPGMVAFALVSAAAGLGPGFFHALQVTGGISVQWTSIPTGWGLAGGWVADWLGHPAAKESVLGAARSVGTLLTGVALVVLWWRVREAPNDPEDTSRYAATVLTACGAALLVVVVLGEAVHPWYLLWGLVPLAAVARPEPARLDARLGTGLAVVCAVVCFLVLPDGYNLARSTVVPGSLFDVALTIAAGWYGVRWLRRRREQQRSTRTR
jgi:alpha-1,6-mannosyltransferase